MIVKVKLGENGVMIEITKDSVTFIDELNPNDPDDLVAMSVAEWNCIKDKIDKAFTFLNN